MNSIKSEGVGESLVIPRTADDITEEWVKKIFSPKSGTVTVSSNIQKDFGYVSNICRVSFISDQTGNLETFLVKLLPENSLFMEFALDQKVDQREIKFYSDVMPQLIHIDPELQNHLCKFYFGKIVEASEDQAYSSMLGLEDLTGYQNLNPNAIEWKENMQKVMEFCANFHAVSHTMEILRKKKLSEAFLFCMGANENEDPKVLLEMGKNNFSRLDTLLTEQNCPVEVIQSYSGLSKCWEKVFKQINWHGRQLPCLIHGDIWPSNVMVNDEDPTAPIKIIDWQTLSYLDPTFDISVAILLSLPIIEHSKGNVDFFAKNYFQKFLSYCQKYGHKYTLRNEKEFMEFFNSWGMGMTYLWLFFNIDIFKSMKDKEKLQKLLEFLYYQYRIPQFLKEKCS